MPSPTTHSCIVSWRSDSDAFIPNRLYVNWHWNPFVVLTRKLLTRMLGSDLASKLDGLAIGDAPPLVPSHADAKAAAAAKDTANGMRWLMPGEHDNEHIAIVSYPRSGNSLMRGLLEKITGIYTGCDTRPDRSLSQELQNYGMKGEVGVFAGCTHNGISHVVTLACIIRASWTIRSGS